MLRIWNHKYLPGIMRIEIFGRIIYEHHIVPYTQHRAIVLVFGKSKVGDKVKHERRNKVNRHKVKSYMQEFRECIEQGTRKNEKQGTKTIRRRPTTTGKTENLVGAILQ